VGIPGSAETPGSPEVLVTLVSRIVLASLVPLVRRKPLCLLGCLVPLVHRDPWSTGNPVPPETLVPLEPLRRWESLFRWGIPLVILIALVPLLLLRALRLPPPLGNGWVGSELMPRPQRPGHSDHIPAVHTYNIIPTPVVSLSYGG